MTRNSDAIEGLRAAVESVRAREFSTLDPKIVEEILNVQYTFAEVRGEGRKQTDQLVTRYVADHLPNKEGGANAQS